MSTRRAMQEIEHEFWFRWETALWRGDSRLNMCSAQARGVWVEAIMCMREGKPGGYLTDPATGQPLTLEEMAAAFRLPTEQVREGLRELHQRGVFSMREDRAIFCRKIVREMALSSTRSRAANKRYEKEEQPLSDFADAKPPAKDLQNVSSVFCILSSREGSGEGDGNRQADTEDGSRALKTADALFAVCCKHNPKHPDRASWEVAGRLKAASELLQLRHGGIEWERMDDAIRWLPTDDFWLGTITSASGFIRNFTTIEGRVLSAKKKAAASPAAVAAQQSERDAEATRKLLDEMRSAKERAVDAPPPDLAVLKKNLARMATLPGDPVTTRKKGTG